jgi:leader peptidase (prepilin peptidase) / N-methyltransferase
VNTLPTSAWWTATTTSVPLWAAVVLAGVVGLVLGSFLNVVVYRVPRGLSVVRPGSFCPSCGTAIRPRDNIPVLSWLVLGGRCRTCGAPISVRYPLVEAGTGALFALVAAALGPHWAVVGLCALAATLAASLAIELDGRSAGWLMPAIGTLLGLAGLAGAGIAERHWAHLGGAAAGVAMTAAAAPVLDRWMVTVRVGSGRPPGGQQRAWVLLPAGAVLGWSGPAGAAAGTGLLCLLLLVLPATRATNTVGGKRHSSARAASTDGSAGEHRRRMPSSWESAGPAMAAAASAVVAVVVALGVGATLT